MTDKNVMLLIGGGAILYFASRLQAKKQFTEQIEPFFRGIGFGMQGAMPHAIIKMGIRNPTTETQKVVNINASIPTPEGSIKTDLANPFTIAPTGSSNFELTLKPTLSLVPALKWVAQNYKDGKVFLDVKITTPEATFTKQITIKP